MENHKANITSPQEKMFLMLHSVSYISNSNLFLPYLYFEIVNFPIAIKWFILSKRYLLHPSICKIPVIIILSVNFIGIPKRNCMSVCISSQSGFIMVQWKKKCSMESLVWHFSQFSEFAIFIFESKMLVGYIPMQVIIDLLVSHVFYAKFLNQL